MCDVPLLWVNVNVSLRVVGVGDWAEPGLSVEALFRAHLPLLYPLKQIAYLVMPDDFASWAFSLPALALFPIRSVVSAFFGQWVLAGARGLR